MHGRLDGLQGRLGKQHQLLLPAQMAVHQEIGQILQRKSRAGTGAEEPAVHLGLEHLQKVLPEPPDPGPVAVGQLRDAQEHQGVAEQPCVVKQGQQHPPQVLVQGVQARLNGKGDLLHLGFQQGVGQIGLAGEIIVQVSDTDPQLGGNGAHGNIVIAFFAEESVGGS